MGLFKYALGVYRRFLKYPTLHIVFEEVINEVPNIVTRMKNFLMRNVFETLQENI